MLYIPLIFAYSLLNMSNTCGIFFNEKINMRIGDEISLYERPNGVIVSISLFALTSESIGGGDVIAVLEFSEGDKEEVVMRPLKVGQSFHIDFGCNRLLKFTSIDRKGRTARFIIIGPVAQ